MRRIRLWLSFVLFASIAFPAKLPEKEICAAALEALLHTNAFERYTRSYQEAGQTIHVFSSRGKPGNLDACYILGNRVVWRVEKAIGINKGRWRIDPMDEKVFFKASGDNVTISLEFADGSKNENRYNLKKLTHGIK